VKKFRTNLPCLDRRAASTRLGASDDALVDPLPRRRTNSVFRSVTWPNYSSCNRLRQSGELEAWPFVEIGLHSNELRLEMERAIS